MFGVHCAFVGRHRVAVKLTNDANEFAVIINAWCTLYACRPPPRCRMTDQRRGPTSSAAAAARCTPTNAASGLLTTGSAGQAPTRVSAKPTGLGTVLLEACLNKAFWGVRCGCSSDSWGRFRPPPSPYMSFRIKMGSFRIKIVGFVAPGVRLRGSPWGFSRGRATGAVAAPRDAPTMRAKL